MILHYQLSIHSNGIKSGLIILWYIHHSLVHSPFFDTFIMIDTPWTRVTVDVIRDQEAKMNHV